VHATSENPKKKVECETLQQLSVAVAHCLDTTLDFDYCIMLGADKVLKSIRRENGAFAPF